MALLASVVPRGVLCAEREARGLLEVDGGEARDAVGLERRVEVRAPEEVGEFVDAVDARDLADGVRALEQRDEQPRVREERELGRGDQVARLR